MKPETPGCCFLPQKDCGQGGDLDTLDYISSHPTWFPLGFVAEGFQEWQHASTDAERNQSAK